MAADNRTATVAKNLACYERVTEIIKDRLALEAHMRGRNASFREILFAREDAYCNIVSAVLGSNALFKIKPAKAPQSRKRNTPRNSGCKKTRGTSPMPLARTIRVHRWTENSLNGPKPS
jgi:hypothetical protein